MKPSEVHLFTSHETEQREGPFHEIEQVLRRDFYSKNYRYTLKCSLWIWLEPPSPARKVDLLTIGFSYLNQRKDSLLRWAAQRQ